MNKYRGVIKFIGPTAFSQGVWYGLEMDTQVGKHEGTVLDVQYFVAGPKRGTFVKEAQLRRFCAQQQASSSIAGLARISTARRAMRSEMLGAAFNRLDADDEAQAMARQQALLNTALGAALQRGRPTEEQLAAWAREAAAMPVEASYAGPALQLPITEAQALALTDAFRAGRSLHYKYVALLLASYRLWASGLPTLTELHVPAGARLTIVGDTHGQLEDLYTIFSLNGLPSPSNAYLINGDYVDRGPRGCEVVCTLMAWCLAGVPADAQGAPHAPGAPLPPCHIHRGNHESHSQNSAGGFLSEVLAKYSGVSVADSSSGSITSALNLYDTFQAAFDSMPLASVVSAGEGVGAGHGAGAGAGAGAAPHAPRRASGTAAAPGGMGAALAAKLGRHHAGHSAPIPAPALASTPTSLYLDLPPCGAAPPASLWRMVACSVTPPPPWLTLPLCSASATFPLACPRPWTRCLRTSCGATRCQACAARRPATGARA